MQGYVDPTANSSANKILKGLKKLHGTPKRKASGLLFEHIQMMSDYLAKNSSLQNSRNNALLLLQFAGALRVSELHAIKFEHLSFIKEGVSILIPKSKTDQETEEKTIFIPYSKKSYCPISALKFWISTANIKDGFIFRNIKKIETDGENKLS